MNSFLITCKPKSYNHWKKNHPTGQAYLTTVTNAFLTKYANHQLLTDDLYGLVYYFFKDDRSHDADNISKPLWDCLVNVVYSDDVQIKLRIAGVFDTTSFYE